MRALTLIKTGVRVLRQRNHVSAGGLVKFDWLRLDLAARVSRESASRRSGALQVLPARARGMRLIIGSSGRALRLRPPPARVHRQQQQLIPSDRLIACGCRMSSAVRRPKRQVALRCLTRAHDNTFGGLWGASVATAAAAAAAAHRSTVWPNTMRARIDRFARFAFEKARCGHRRCCCCCFKSARAATAANAISCKRVEWARRINTFGPRATRPTHTCWLSARARAHSSGQLLAG